MLPKIKVVEVVISKADVKETGLLLYYDAITHELRLQKDNNTTTMYNLYACSIVGILTTDEQGITETYYTSVSADQKEAEARIENLLQRLRIDGRCNASGYVNTKAYIGVPDKYSKTNNVTSPQALLPVVTNNNHINHVNHVTRHVPKPTYLSTVTPYYAEDGAGNVNKKVGIIIRKSDLPTEKVLVAMAKKVTQAMLGTYKSKALELPEDDELLQEVDTATDQADALKSFYGEGYEDDYNMYRGMMV